MSQYKFDVGYTLRVTVSFMRRAVNIGIKKCMSVINDPERKEEQPNAFKALMLLHGLKQVVDDFQKQNKDSFGQRK